jgi:hypothetical protein
MILFQETNLEDYIHLCGTEIKKKCKGIYNVTNPDSAIVQNGIDILLMF